MIVVIVFSYLIYIISVYYNSTTTEQKKNLKTLKREYNFF